MQIAIQILYTTGWKDIADIVLPVAKNYCDKHGYKLVDVEYNEPAQSDMGYDKFRWVKKLSVVDVDVIFCLDLDTLITNHGVTVESFLDEEHDFYICKDYNSINAGSFIIRKSLWAESFIDFVLSQQGIDKMYCEQNAIEKYMELNPQEQKIKVLPHPSINSYFYGLYPEIPAQTHEQGEWVMGDFILHLPGVSLERRKQILEKTKDLIV